MISTRKGKAGKKSGLSAVPPPRKATKPPAKATSGKAAGKPSGTGGRKGFNAKSEYDAEFAWPPGIPRQATAAPQVTAPDYQSKPPPLSRPFSSRRWESEYDDEFDWPEVMPTDTTARPTAEKDTEVASDELEPVGLHAEYSIPTTEYVQARFGFHSNEN